MVMEIMENLLDGMDFIILILSRNILNMLFNNMYLFKTVHLDHLSFKLSVFNFLIEIYDTDGSFLFITIINYYNNTGSFFSPVKSNLFLGKLTFNHLQILMVVFSS